MSQIGVDLSCLPPIPEGFRYVVTAVDYFTKWVEARPLKSKTAEEVTSFLFNDIVYRHGCVDIQINDQGREFINSVSDELHRLCGTKQKVTSAYHPQANGLVERQNRTTKDGLVKCLSDKKTGPNDCSPFSSPTELPNMQALDSRLSGCYTTETPGFPLKWSFRGLCLILMILNQWIHNVLN